MNSRNPGDMLRRMDSWRAPLFPPLVVDQHDELIDAGLIKEVSLDLLGSLRQQRVLLNVAGNDALDDSYLRVFESLKASAVELDTEHLGLALEDISSTLDLPAPQSPCTPTVTGLSGRSRASSGCILCTTGSSMVATGIDLPTYSFTGNAIHTQGFAVASNGLVTANNGFVSGGAGVSGSLAMVGATSGRSTIGVTATSGTLVVSSGQTSNAIPLVRKCRHDPDQEWGFDDRHDCIVAIGDRPFQ
jgi:hypothetical protein